MQELSVGVVLFVLYHPVVEAELVLGILDCDSKSVVDGLAVAELDETLNVDRAVERRAPFVYVFEGKHNCGYRLLCDKTCEGGARQTLWQIKAAIHHLTYFENVRLGVLNDSNQ